MAYDEDLEGLDFTRSAGARAAEEIDQKQKEERAKNRVQYDRVGYFSIKEDGGSLDFRFLNDVEESPNQVTPPWQTVLTHSFVPTKPQPLNYKGNNWSSTRGAVCRHDDLCKAKYGDVCPLDDFVYTSGYKKGKKCQASPKTYAFAVLREEVFGTEEMLAAGECDAHEVGKKIGMRDKMKEVAVIGADGKPTEETQWVPEIVLIEQAWDNFFGIVAGMAAMWPTVLNRDFRCTRKGIDQDTKYRFAAGDPYDVTMPDGSVRCYDLRDPDIFNAKYPKMPNLYLHLARLCSDDYYNRFFTGPQDDDGQDDASGGNRSASAAPTTRPAAPKSDASAEKVAAMVDRVKSYGQPVPAGAPASAPAAATPPAARRARPL
jgi:hypothetical protein